MAALNPQIYTTTQINTVINSLVVGMNTAGNEYYQSLRYGYCDCSKIYLFRKMLRAYYLLSNWTQASNGSTTGYVNRITQTQLTATIMWVKTHCNC